MLKIGVQSNFWYDRENPLASFEFIKSCGFDAVDFNIDNYLSTAKLNKEGLQETFFDQSIEEILAYFTPLKEASEKTGVEICQVTQQHAVICIAVVDHMQVHDIRSKPFDVSDQPDSLQYCKTGCFINILPPGTAQKIFKCVLITNLAVYRCPAAGIQNAAFVPQTQKMSMNCFFNCFLRTGKSAADLHDTHVELTSNT